MYSLIFGSKLESAKRFKHWVTSEVLPSIREHGVYATPQTVDEMLANPDTMIELLTNYKAEKARADEAKRQVAEANKQIAELKPKADVYDAIDNVENTISIDNFAKLLYDEHVIETGRNRLIAWMLKKGYIMKANNGNNRIGEVITGYVPKQAMRERGLLSADHKEIVDRYGRKFLCLSVLVTGKGVTKLTEWILKDIENGILDKNGHLSEELNDSESGGDNA